MWSNTFCYICVWDFRTVTMPGSCYSTDLLWLWFLVIITPLKPQCDDSLAIHPKFENLNSFKTKQFEHWIFPNKKVVANNSKLSGFSENSFILDESKWMSCRAFWWKTSSFRLSKVPSCLFCVYFEKFWSLLQQNILFFLRKAIFIKPSLSFLAEKKY